MREHVPLNRPFQFIPIRSGPQVELCIESVHVEEVTVGLSRRRTPTAVADAPEVIPALASAVIEGLGYRHIVR